MDNVEALFWTRMRAFTRARIGLGRAGDAQPTQALLDFQLGYARARDAVYRELNVSQLEDALSPRPILRVHSQATNRSAYLRRPDLGRLLTEDSAAHLRDYAEGDWDLVFVLADGLSAGAAEKWGPAVIEACRVRLPSLRMAPIVIATHARVALGDQVGEYLGARCVMVLLGERPGLSVPDSLGIYITWAPQTGTSDNLRNCISNIHRDGLAPEVAATRAAWLVREAIRLRLTGVALKEDAEEIRLNSTSSTRASAPAADLPSHLA